jgi:acetoacetyl-CoA reductase
MTESLPRPDRRVALVSGGSRGIGAAICRSLGATGATVAVNYRSNEAAAAEVVASIEAAGGHARAFAADVGDPADCVRLVSEVEATLGEVDILVHNAGLQHSAMAHRMTDTQWHESLAVNLSAAFYLARAVLPAMRASRRGCIVFVSSASGSVGQIGAAGYVAAKHGLHGLTKALALESARKGIRVNAVAPGITNTDMIAELDDQQRAGLLARVPLARIADPEEVAATVDWVIRGATYSTGNIFHVSGGVAMP